MLFPIFSTSTLNTVVNNYTSNSVFAESSASISQQIIVVVIISYSLHQCNIKSHSLPRALFCPFRLFSNTPNFLECKQFCIHVIDSIAQLTPAATVRCEHVVWMLKVDQTLKSTQDTISNYMSDSCVYKEHYS